MIFVGKIYLCLISITIDLDILNQENIQETVLSIKKK